MPGGYHAVPATRLLDTHDGTGAPAGLRPAGSTTAVTVTGVHGIPATGVSVVALTLVATGTTANGFLTAFPHGTGAPTASSLNLDGRADRQHPRPGPGRHRRRDRPGRVPQREPCRRRRRGDVESVDAAPAAGAITAVAPSRLLDTEPGSAPPRQRSAEDLLQLAVAGRGGVPATGAGSVVLNLTATGGTTLGYVTASPADPGSAPTSTVNFRPADTVANLVTVGLGPDGGVDLRVTASGSVAARRRRRGVGVGGCAGRAARGGAGRPGAAARLPRRRWVTAQPDDHRCRRGAGERGGCGAAERHRRGLTATGFVQVVPRGAGLPTSSSLNFQGGRTKASAVIAAVSSTGGVDLVVSAGASLRLVVDVTGYVLGPPVDTTPPAAPSAVTTTVVGSSVEVSWTPSAARAR